MPPKKKRGPYKQYLRNPEVAYPRTTAWLRGQAAAGENRQPNPPEENVQGDGGNDQYVHDGSSSASSVSSDAGSDVNQEQQAMIVESDEDSVSETSGLSSRNQNSDNYTDNELSERDEAESAAHSDSASDMEDDHVQDEYHEGNEDHMPLSPDNFPQAADSDSASDMEDDHVQDEHHEGNEDHMPLPPDNFPQGMRGPLLYPGAQITSEESEVLIKSFIVRWNIKENAVEHLLRLLDCHMPVAVLDSKFCFLNKFPVGPSKQLRYFCPNCSLLLPSLIEDNFVCECGSLCTVKELRKDGRQFVQMSISEQIQHIMGKPEVVRHLRKECQESDIVSGKLYKHFRQGGSISENDISLQWNTDGVKPCTTSKVTMYPIFACINELPYRLRTENMMLCGLYYGKKKPVLNEFLKPFVEELTVLRELGVNCTVPGREEPVNIKVHTLLCSVDSVARAPLQGIMAHNGRHGCSFCLRRGRRMARGRGFARFYIGGHVGQPRSAEQHIGALQTLSNYNSIHRRKKKHVEGVTSESTLLLLPGFNIVKSFVPDYMHLVLEGVVKTFWSHWTSSEYANEPWYLSKVKRDQVSDKLLTIKPPTEVTRVPRSVDEMCLWRAHELKSFLLYYSLVLLKGILPMRYLRHWFLLVFSISVFLKEKIEAAEFLKASEALQKFVQDIHVLYPQCYSMYTFNTHMLLHIPKAVENYGALWAFSTFPYENMNGVLSRLIRGPQGIPVQICSSFLRLRHVHQIGIDIFNKEESAPVGKELFHSMLGINKRTVRRTYQCGEGLRYFGGPNNYALSLIEKASLQELLQQTVDSNALSYRRLIYNGKVFHAETTGALRVRDNSLAKLSDGRLVVISAILTVKISNSTDLVNACVCKCLERFDENFCQDNDLAISSSEIMYTCHLTERICAVLPQSIRVKCVGVPYGAAVCVIPLANAIERD